MVKVNKPDDLIKRFKNPALGELTVQQIRYAPHDIKLQQMDAAEQLVAELKPDASYKWPSLCKKITAYKPKKYPDLMVDGEDAIHDLGLFVEELSDAADLDSTDAAEDVLTVEDVSRRYSVSTKTVDRWRKRGLISRRFRFGKRKRVGFYLSSIERFAESHGEEVERGSKFTQLTEKERMHIVEQARLMARRGGCPTEISRRLARKLDRSAETIRYTLKHFDEDHPEQAVFTDAVDPADAEQRAEIFDRHHRGVGVEKLAKDFCKSVSSVRRILTEERARRLFDTPIDFMDSTEFHEDDAEKTICGEPPAAETTGVMKPPSGLPPCLASLYTVPLLNKAQEQFWFRKMNFRKFQAAELREAIDPVRPKVREMRKVEALLDEATQIKNFLIRSNLRLVVSIAKKHIQPGRNFFEMVSDGNMSLIRAIEKFDYAKGNKFSTYATWAIMKNFARSIPQEHKVLDRFRTGTEEVFAFRSDQRGNPFRDEHTNRQQRDAISGLLDQLDEREKAIIMHRYGLGQGAEPETLEQVGERFGVTKERIRQIEARALRKARSIAEDEKLDIPGV